MPDCKLMQVRLVHVPGNDGYECGWYIVTRCRDLALSYVWTQGKRKDGKEYGWPSKSAAGASARRLAEYGYKIKVLNLGHPKNQEELDAWVERGVTLGEDGYANRSTEN